MSNVSSGYKLIIEYQKLPLAEINLQLSGSHYFTIIAGQLSFFFFTEYGLKNSILSCDHIEIILCGHFHAFITAVNM